ncbi:MAG: hypothetical protein K0S61_4515 [Anaerocolumna sp.]|jgi:transcriptional regulator with XRE-family HTH domain|nr:hypothetical protein [Anaerocolumna sp.]
MALEIGKIIKKLRNQKDITQDHLAEYLGVTAQAISRWESGHGYPDIETLPALATFFGVSIEVLMGVDLTQEEQDQTAIEIVQLTQKGDLKEAIRNGRLAVQKYPSNHSIILGLVSAITVYIGLKDSSLPETEKNELIEEGLLLLKRTMRSDNEMMILTAKTASCILLGYVDRLEEAVQIANSLPVVQFTQEFNLPRYLVKNQKESYILKILPNLLTDMAPVFLSLEYAYSEKGCPAFYEYNYKECKSILELWNFSYGSKEEHISQKRQQFIYLFILVRLTKLASEAGYIDESIGYLEEMIKSVDAVCSNFETWKEGNINTILKGQLSSDKELDIEDEKLWDHNIAYILYYGYYKKGYFHEIDKNHAAVVLLEKLYLYAS